MSVWKAHAPGVRFAASLMAVVAICPVVAGCSVADDKKAGGGEGPPVPEVTAFRQIDSAADLELPVAPYLFSDAELSRLMGARELLIRECMQELGFDYQTPDGSRAVGPRTLTERRYGLADVTQAKRDGYHLFGPEVRPEPKLPPEQYRAVTGEGSGKDIPKGGCAGQAERALGGEKPFGPSDLAQTINGKSYELSMRDNRVRKVFTSWSACMRKQGYTYKDPMAAMSAPEFSAEEIGPGETEAAQHDVKCKEKVNLIGVWHAVESAYQKELVQEHASELRLVLEAKREQLKESRKMMSGA
ncbi:hypothetical protein ACIGV8_29320 [Streptomyces albidoflavus]